MLSMRSTRLKRYTVRLSSPRVVPSHSSSELEWDNKILYLRKISSSYPKNKIKYTVATVALAVTITILVTIAIIIPSVTKSKSTTTEDTTSTLNTTLGSNIPSSSIASASTAAVSLPVTTTFVSSQATATTESTTTSTTGSISTTSETTTTESTTSTSVTTTTTTKSTSTTSETTTTESTTSTSVTTITTTESTTMTSTTTTESTSTTSETTTTTSDSTTTTTETFTSTSSTTTVGPPCAFRWYPNATTVAGQLGYTTATPKYLNFPIGILIDLPNTLYVADALNNRIQQYLLGNTTGRTVAGPANGGVGTGANSLSTPSDVAVDLKGNVYVADSYNNRVQLWRVNATTGVTIAGTGSSGGSLTELSFPRAIAIDQSTDTIYVSDGNNNRILSFTLNSTVGTIVAGGNGQGINGNQLYQPRGIEFDQSTNSLIIVNYGAHNVVRWQLGASNWTLVAGYFNGSAANVNSSQGSTSNRLYGPWDATVDPFGNIYVADRFNHRIQFFRPSELNGTTIAGVTSVSGSTAYLLNYPLSVALDSDLNLYVSDSSNNRIQKFTCY